MRYGDVVFHYIPSPINKELTEAQLIELYQALFALYKADHSEREAQDLANITSYGAFRNLIDYNTLLQWIVRKSKQVQIA
jgi:hypothetical protein